MKLFYLYLSFFALVGTLSAQKKFTISGKAIDQETGEMLVGVNVFDVKSSSGTTSNEYGFYSLTLPQDSVYLLYSYIGYNDKMHYFLLEKDTVIDIIMGQGVDMKEIVVEESSIKEQLNSTQMGKLEVTAQQAKEIPVIFGEVDILKVLQLKPGVQSGGEGSSGIFVRGGGSDQNLFILDEAPVYNPNHLFGFFSTFNADAVKNVTLYKSGFPANFGGKLSSVVEVFMREGNRKKYQVSGGLGLISSRLAVEGPLVKDKGAFIISFRRTYVDVITELFNQANKDNPDWNQLPAYNFFDFNAKFNYDLDAKNKLFASGYWGRDFFVFKDGQINFNFNWGNISSTARWNHILSPRLFTNTVFTFSDYVYDISNKFDQFSVSLGSGIRDMNLKTEFDWFPNPKHTIKFGINGIYHRFKVNRFNAGAADSSFSFAAGKFYYAGEYGLYFSDDYEINKRLKVNYGLRLSGFNNDNKFYYGIEPRAAIKYSLTENLSIKGNYSRMYQYIHLVSTSGASLPTDVWFPSTSRVKPQFSDLVSAGLAYGYKNKLFFSLEGYYKWLGNQVDFRDGAQLFVNDNLENEFVFGTGKAYGVEFYVEKQAGNWRGWVGYTLSWAWRQFDDIMDGKRFHPRYDQRHNISVVLTYEIPKTPLTLSATWIYGTGNAVSLPVARYFHTDITRPNPFTFIPVFTERNGFRMPAYHRGDIGLVWKLFAKKNYKFKSDLTFSIYNVYNRLNAYFIFIAPEFANEGDQIPTNFQAKVVSLFPIIPTITWNFKF